MSLNSEQQEKVSMFTMLCGVDSEVAETFLVRREWDCELAIDTFFAEGNTGYVEVPPPPTIQNSEYMEMNSESLEMDYLIRLSEREMPIGNLFSKYAAEGLAEIWDEGIQRFCKDLGISCSEPVLLVIAKYFSARTMGVFTEVEFYQGMDALGCKHLGDLADKIPKLKRELDNPREFKEVYRFIFSFAWDAGMRDLAFETALALWGLILTPKYPMTEIWITFLTTKDTKYDISQDTWNMILDIFEESSGNFKNFDDKDAWPLIIGEFIQYYNEPENKRKWFQCKLEKTLPEFSHTCQWIVCTVCQVSYSNQMITKGMDGDYCACCGNTIKPHLFESIRSELVEGSSLLAESLDSEDAFICSMWLENVSPAMRIKLSCDHESWRECFSQWIDFKIFNKQFEADGIQCFDKRCSELVEPAILAIHMTQEQDEKYNDFVLERRGVLRWPKCNIQIEVDDLNRKNAHCGFCGNRFCIRCGNSPHTEEGCEAERVRQLLKISKETGSVDESVAQCPGCKTPYLKDHGCLHVKCLTDSCRIEFCFECSCIRSPTMAHGNHYHRPQCSCYSEYNGDDDKYDESCSECVRLGHLCPRPKDLPVPRLFDLERQPDEE